MPAELARLEEIFAEALCRGDAALRAAFLDEACGGDAELRQRVDSLLAAHMDAANFLNLPEAAGRADVVEPLSEGAGTVIGPYKLLEQIGEGGMGVVFMAEQEEPVRRRVALKIIKPGMDTRQVIARFEAERQALALMDHPNIAKVLDAGTTHAAGAGRVPWGDSEAREDAGYGLRSAATSLGRPYFVMELVSGVPITDYCDRHRLSVRERLELFIQVCHAVQHAHQKGVIHRDLKPSNVLVAEYDGRPVPKVIDFGVAKATAQRLAERTMFTQFGQLIGTFEYMSPEQARFNQLDVDTRSDVYSLGVLLYQLLTGSTPFEKQGLETVAFDETLRIIREQEPPRPSTMLSTGDKLRAIAASRHTDPGRLSKEVRGELDWIVMKALEKERNRRYESASALAADVARHLAHEPVAAGPPSRFYRAGKFVRRHRAPVAAACLAAVAIVGSVVAITWQAVRATRAERTALAERDAKEEALRQAIASAAAERAAKDREATQRKKAEDIANFLITAFNVQYPEHDIQAVADVLKKSAQEIQGVYADNSAANEALLAVIGRAYAGLRRFDEAERMYRRCLEVATDRGLADRVRRELAVCLLREGKYDEGRRLAEGFYREKLELVDNAKADALLAAWEGMPGANELPSGEPGMDGLEFDGASHYVVLPRLYFDGRPPWTVEAIVRPLAVDPSDPSTGAPAGWTSLVSSADAGSIGLESVRRKWTLELYTAGIPGAEWTDNYASASAGVEVALGKWQHVAGVWDGSELRVYVDGRLQSSREGVAYCTQLTFSPIFLGADPANLAYGEVAEGFMRGRLRGVRISRAAEYADSFTPPERLETTPATIGLYDFTIDAGRYAVDQSGHGHHGIIMGAKYVRASR